MGKTRGFTDKEIARNKLINEFLAIGIAIYHLNYFLDKHKDVELRWQDGLLRVFFKGEDTYASLGGRGVPLHDMDFSNIIPFTSAVIQGK